LSATYIVLATADDDLTGAFDRVGLGVGSDTLQSE
jgi:hypothetical protein